MSARTGVYCQRSHILRELRGALKLCRVCPRDDQSERNDTETKKCFVIAASIGYLGNVIAPRRLRVASKAIEDVSGLKYPTVTFELRLFLGLYNVHRLFVPNFSRMAALLNKDLKKCEPETSKLNEEERQMKDDLNESQAISPVLSLPKPGVNMLFRQMHVTNSLGVYFYRRKRMAKFDG